MAFDETINRALLQFLQERTKDNNGGVCIRFSLLDHKEAKHIRDLIGITSKMKAPEKKALVKKYLGDTLRMKAANGSEQGAMYLYRVMPPDEAAARLISSNPGGTPGKIPFGVTVPAKAEILNRLAKSGKIWLEVDKSLKVVRIWPLASMPASPIPVHPVGDASETRRREFKTAYDALLQGKYFVRICDLRRRLGWDRGVFEETLRALRDRMVIQLHPGDTHLMTEQDVRDCFLDENGSLHLNLTWRN